MSSPRTAPSWYDILGVRRDASPQQIKAAWRDATDKFEPGSGNSQFRLFNEAADVLLDPHQRAAYDAQLDEESERSPRRAAEPATPPPADGSATQDEGEKPRRRRGWVSGRARRRPERGGAATATGAAAATGAAVAHKDRAEQRSGEDRAQDRDAQKGEAGPSTPGLRIGTIPLALLALLLAVVLAVGVVLWRKNQDFSATQDAGMEAGAAAEHAVPAVLSYDYRHLAADRDQALRFLTPHFRNELRSTYRVLQGTPGQPGAAVQTRAVVTAVVRGSAVAAGATPDQANIVVFVDQSTSRLGGAPRTSLNRLVVRMVHSPDTNQWLLDNISSY